MIDLKRNQKQIHTNFEVGKNKQKLYLEIKKSEILDLDMNINDKSKDAKKGKENESMDENGSGTGFKGSKFDELFSTMDLKHKPWR